MSRKSAFAIAAAALIGAAAVYLFGTSEKFREVTNREVAEMRNQAESLKSTQPANVKNRAPSESAGQQKVLSSKAAWTSFGEKYRAGDYAWIVQNARTAPSAGSYSYALRVLWECLAVLREGPYESQVAKIRESPISEQERSMRLGALENWHRPCRPLGGIDAIRSQQQALSREILTANDAIENLHREARKLADPEGAPRSIRQQRLSEYLSLEDAEAVMALRGVLTASGASLNGIQIQSSELQAYGYAWDLVLCSHYGRCGGPGPLAYQRCATRGECVYLDSYQRVQQLMPPFMGQRVQEFHNAIIANINNRNYAAFGVP